MRVKIHLKCSSCGSQNYLTSKNSKTHPDKIEVLKYCPKERKVTLHFDSSANDLFERSKARGFEAVMQRLTGFLIFVWLLIALILAVLSSK